MSAYYRPDSHEVGGTSWWWSDRAYDGDPDSFAYPAHSSGDWGQWGDWKEFYLSSPVVSASKVRVRIQDGRFNLRVFKDGEWETLAYYYDAPTSPEYCEFSFEPGTVTKIDYQGIDWYDAQRLYDIQVWGDYAPTSPTDLECEGQTDPTGVTDLTPEFTAIGNDPDAGDTFTDASIQVGTSEGLADKWDSGWFDIPDFVEGTRCSAIMYAGSAIAQLGETFYWRIRFKDAHGIEGPWSSWATFAMAPKQVSIADAGMAVDSAVAIVVVKTADAGVAQESISSVQAFIPIGDAGIATELLARLNWKPRVGRRATYSGAPARVEYQAIQSRIRYTGQNTSLKYELPSGARGDDEA